MFNFKINYFRKFGKIYSKIFFSKIEPILVLKNMNLTSFEILSNWEENMIYWKCKKSKKIYWKDPKI